MVLEEIYKRARELNGDLSTYYQEYTTAAETLKKYTDLYERVRELRVLQAEEHISKIEGAEPDLGREKYLSKLYSDLCLNVIANAYFEKEKTLLEIYNKVVDIIGEGIDVDYFGIF
jgi:cell fate (sporulation/competence/biofilm development) regulator YlbF (YheA/YmcA/DUF963 family)